MACPKRNSAERRWKAWSFSISRRMPEASQRAGSVAARSVTRAYSSLALRLTDAKDAHLKRSQSWWTSSLRRAFCSSSSSLSMAMVWMAKSAAHSRSRRPPAML